MKLDIGGFESFKGRKLDPRLAVRVYRNLNRAGVWYSLMQKGRVIGHVRSIVLHTCHFKVNVEGARRAVVNGRKNVHAFVVERVFSGPERTKETHPARYNINLGRFEVEVPGYSQQINSAAYVWLGSFGMLVNNAIIQDRVA